MAHDSPAAWVGSPRHGDGRQTVAGAVSGDQVSVVGYKGGGPAAQQQTEAVNDDAYGACSRSLRHRMR